MGHSNMVEREIRIAIIIPPCHRVLRSNGSLGGYSSGVDIKKLLLSHENL